MMTEPFERKKRMIESFVSNETIKASRIWDEDADKTDDTRKLDKTAMEGLKDTTTKLIDEPVNYEVNDVTRKRDTLIKEVKTAMTMKVLEEMVTEMNDKGVKVLDTKKKMDTTMKEPYKNIKEDEMVITMNDMSKTNGQQINSMMRKLEDPFVVNETTLLAAEASTSNSKQVLRMRGGAGENDLGSEDDEGDREGDGEGNIQLEEDRLCEHCKIKIKSLIPHVKQKAYNKCKDYYFDKYLKNPSENVAENWKTLGTIVNNQRKNEKQRLRRLNKEYRDKMRQDQMERRQQKKCDVNVMAREYSNSINAIMSRQCAACNCFVSPQFTEAVSEDHNLYDENDQILICKWCSKMESEMDRWMKLGGVDEELELEYQTWARENFSVDKKICSLKNKIRRNDHPQNVGILVFNEKNRRHFVAYPNINADTSCISIEQIKDGVIRNEPTVLLPETCPEKDCLETVSREECELASRMSRIDLIDQLSVVFKDRLAKMQQARNYRMERNKDIVNGRLGNGEIFVINSESTEGCLRDIKGTKDQLKKERNENEFKQCQNGLTNIQLSYTVFDSFQSVHSDPTLALCIVRSRGYNISSMEKYNEEDKAIIEHRLQCRDGCDPFLCQFQAHHPTPQEMLQINPEEIEPLTVCRYLSEKINIFIKTCVEPVAKDYDLFILFDRPSGPDGEGGLSPGSGFAPDSGFCLSGHIWIDALTDYNISGEKIPAEVNLIPEILRKENLVQYLGNGYGGSQVVQHFVTWPDHLYSFEKENITSTTMNRLTENETSDMRQVSIFEAIFYGGRGLKTSWSSQSVKLINSTDPRKASGFFLNFYSFYFYYEKTKFCFPFLE